VSVPPLIKLENVTKSYPGVVEPAVKNLDLEVFPGEILVLVGPSGCGKSTTLRLINRMIEPTSGRIIYEGEDVTKGDPNELRRRIGYVIQQIGLFPHRTIAENIATVPKLLKWPKDKIRARVDELLEVVSMDPSIYRDRYPAELSGGQAQRVGVARALGADPDVLLMDEPFGAIDPITRDRLQNEFLRLQGELKKTIVFVTHDIDEAVKMGDRIAILREQSEIATLRRVKDIELSPLVTLKEPFQRDQALREMNDANTSVAVLLDKEDHPTRWLDEKALNRSSPLDRAGRPIVVQLQPEDTLQDALSAMLTTAAGMAVVVDARGHYLGGCTVESLAQLLISTGAEGTSGGASS
jgi:osmoprotectant transport system ATP-binding protein